VSHVTRTLLSRSKGQGHQAASFTAALTRQAAAAVSGERIRRGKVLVRCGVLGGARRFGAHRRRRGAGSYRGGSPPTACLFRSQRSSTQQVGLLVVARSNCSRIGVERRSNHRSCSHSPPKLMSWSLHGFAPASLCDDDECQSLYDVSRRPPSSEVLPCALTHPSDWLFHVGNTSSTYRVARKTGPLNFLDCNVNTAHK